MNEFMNIKQASEYSGLTVGTLYQFKSKGKIVVYKCGKALRFKKEDLDNLFKMIPAIPKVK